MDILWFFLVLGRIWLVLIPQTGYIHPDEFFQTVEVTAGDVFNYSVAKPWEFQTTQPIRSSVLNFVLIGLPYHTANLVMFYTGNHMSAYLLLVVPRLCMALLSIVVDLAALRLCSVIKSNNDICMVLVSSSYLSLTYYTRTFTNTFETFIFCIFILTIVNCFGKKDKERLKLFCKPAEIIGTRSRNGPLFSRSNVKKCTHKGDNKKKTIKDIYEKELTKLSAPMKCKEVYMKNESVSYAFWSFAFIGIITVVGIFNRPTFAAYVVVPLAFRFYSIYLYQKENIRPAIHGVVSGSTFSFVFLVILDSIYYKGKEILWRSLCQLLTDVSLQLNLSIIGNFICNLVIAPWNFITYNINQDNLAEHGIHPRYLHFVVNMPLLFGPMILCLPMFLCKILKRPQEKEELNSELIKNVQATSVQKTGKESSLDQTQMSISISIFNFILLTSVLAPVLLLSMFAHQEPRFLIPLLPLMTAITANVTHKAKFQKLFFLVWIFFNLVLTYIYGFLHQGGLVQALSYINSGNNIDYNYGRTVGGLKDKYIFFHTYMPPHFLLQSNNSNENILDLKGFAKEDLPSFIMNLKVNHSDKDQKIFLILSHSVLSSVDLTGINVGIEAVFMNHLSIEDPPDFRAVVPKKLTWHECYVAYRNIVSAFSLIMIKIL